MSDGRLPPSFEPQPACRAAADGPGGPTNDDRFASFITAFGPAVTVVTGHGVRQLPGHDGPIALHTLAPGATAHDRADGPRCLVLLDGIGKAALDDEAQRVCAPALLRVPGGARWALTNQGVTVMRWLVVPASSCASTGHDW